MSRVASYSEASFFDGYAFHHIAAFEEHKRLRRINKRTAQAVERRRGNRS